MAVPDDGFVDESAAGGFYLMAYVGRPESTSLATLLNQLKDLAGPRLRGGPARVLHATELSPERRAEAERLIVAARPDMMVVVRAPIGASHEQARQCCLAELVSRLSGWGVRQVVLDSRNDLSRGGPMPLNRIDRQTVSELRAAGEVGADFRIRHADDQHQHGLWMADLLANTAQRSLRLGDPALLAPYAPRLHLVEASLLPMNDRAGLPRQPQGRVASYLDHVWARSAIETPADAAPVGHDQVRQLLVRARALDAPSSLPDAAARPAPPPTPTARPSLLQRVTEQLAALGRPDSPPPTAPPHTPSPPTPPQRILERDR